MVAFLSSDVLIAFFILSLFLNETDTLTQLFLAVICDRVLAELLLTCNQHGVWSDITALVCYDADEREPRYPSLSIWRSGSNNPAILLYLQIFTMPTARIQ